MDAPKFITKEYGPFTGGIWLVVIVGGVGLGLLMRRYMAGRGGDSPTDITGVSGGAVGGRLAGSPYPWDDSGGTLYNQGDIVNDVMEAIDAQKPPPVETRPEVEDRPATIQPVGPGVPLTPVAPPTSPPVQLESPEVVRIRNAILNIFQEEDLPPPTPARLDRLITEVIQGRTLENIRFGLEGYKRSVGLPV